MLTEYEAVMVFDSDTDEAGIKAQIAKIEATVAAHGGEVTKKDIWGRRSLAYPIRKKNYGVYVLLGLNADHSLVADLNRQLRINDTVLRSLIVLKDKFAPDFNPRSRYDAIAGPASDGPEDALPDFPGRDADEEVTI